jgi:hypothetical protein
MTTNRFAKAVFFSVGATLLIACGAAADADDSATQESAIGAGSPALRRNFAKISYGAPGLDFVMIQRAEHESTAGRGNYVRYDVSAHGSVVESASCVITERARDRATQGDALIETKATAVLTAAPDDHGTATLASRSGPTHSAYAMTEVVSVDYECFVDDASYFHVSCRESDGAFECAPQR